MNVLTGRHGWMGIVALVCILGLPWGAIQAQGPKPEERVAEQVREATVPGMDESSPPADPVLDESQEEGTLEDTEAAGEAAEQAQLQQQEAGEEMQEQMEQDNIQGIQNEEFEGLHEHLDQE